MSREGLVPVFILKVTVPAWGILFPFQRSLGGLLLDLRLPQQFCSCLEWAGAFGEASSYSLGFEL